MTESIIPGLNILRRMPPNQVQKSLVGVSAFLEPEAVDELFQRVDQPLDVKQCGQSFKPYLICEYNRDGDSYRSPWSSQYDPPFEDGDGVQPSQQLRELEEHMNNVFQEYSKMYYGTDNVITSVYMWDTEGQGFASCFLVKKNVESSKGLNQGNWDSIHVFDVKPGMNNSFIYKLTSTIILFLSIPDQVAGNVNVGGTLMRTSEEIINRDPKISIQDFHVVNLGKIIEKMENNLRNGLDAVYIGKTQQILNIVRKSEKVQVFGNTEIKNQIEEEFMRKAKA